MLSLTHCRTHYRTIALGEILPAARPFIADLTMRATASFERVLPRGMVIRIIRDHARNQAEGVVVLRVLPSSKLNSRNQNDNRTLVKRQPLVLHVELRIDLDVDTLRRPKATGVQPLS